MTTLMIKDLSLTEELDRTAMAAVHGGRFAFPSLDFSSRFSSDVDVKATQLVDQRQKFAVGNEVALVDNFEPKVTGNQTALNTINVGVAPYPGRILL
jgi:hypothetical protein